MGLNHDIINNRLRWSARSPKRSVAGDFARCSECNRQRFCLCLFDREVFSDFWLKGNSKYLNTLIPFLQPRSLSVSEHGGAAAVPERQFLDR